MKAPWIGQRPPAKSARPRCPNCDKPMQPLITVRHGVKRVERTAYERAEVAAGVFRMVSRPTGEFDTVPDETLGVREWRGDFHGYGAFCSLRCCEAFANAAHRAGYRLKR